MASLGFVGLGLMGTPMALNLVRSGQPTVVWNRTPGKTAELAAAGAEVATSAAEVFDRCSVVLLMLADVAAIEAVLAPARRTAAPARRTHRGQPWGRWRPRPPAAASSGSGRPVVTTSRRRSPAPGSRLSAVNWWACWPANRRRRPGSTAAGARLCRQTVVCGPVPSALRMKLAVNLYLVTMVAALAETVHLARRAGLDLRCPGRGVGRRADGQRACRAIKLAKVLADDYSAQAAAADVAYNCDLIAAEADAIGHRRSPAPAGPSALRRQRRRLGRRRSTT